MLYEDVIRDRKSIRGFKQIPVSIGKKIQKKMLKEYLHPGKSDLLWVMKVFTESVK